MNIREAVKGTTRVYGIIGYPVAHSISPVLQNTIASVLGVSSMYVPFCVEKGNTEKALQGGYALNIQGFNVTVPHKVEVMAGLIDIDPLARQIGAVNTLKRVEGGYKGYNTDLLGLEKSLSMRGIILKDKHVMLIGAGGAANAAAVLAASRGAASLTIANRTLEKAQALAERIQKSYSIPLYTAELSSLSKANPPEILLQTTSLGMGMTAGESPVKDIGIWRGAQAAVDIIYAPWETQFLKDAGKAGVLAVNGFDMLVYQGIASFEIWNDIEIDRNTAEEIRNCLAEYYLRRNDSGSK